jgi:AraC-like DNA-binding protein
MSPTTPWFLHLRRAATGAASTAARELFLVQAARCRTAVERSLPNASLELCFNLGPKGRRLFREGARNGLSPRAAWVVGAHARPLLVEKEVADCDMVGVRLHAGVAEQMFGVPASELSDSLVDLDALWGPVVETVRDRLHAAAEPRARLTIVEQVVAARLARTRSSTDTVLARRLCQVVGAMRQASVSAVAATHGLSHRRVIALFDRHVGMKPKAFHRVDRLRRVVDCAHAERRPSWTRIAHACGYFDQAHLINDFRLQAGITPGEYASAHSSVGRGFVPHRLAGER